MQLHPVPKHSIVSNYSATLHKELDLSQPVIMGILNVTPDSFSDGGQYTHVETALKRCEQMLSEGATIIDIGGESTRPNATPVTTQQELNRVVPIVNAIRLRFGSNIWLSIDTSDPLVFEQSVQVGADIWNDVRALKREGALQTAARLGKPVVLMHMRGEPATMDDHADYQDVTSEVIRELRFRIEIAISTGIHKKNLIVDPGFGFAKDYRHHQILLNELYKLQALNLPILFGISRKRFLKEVLEQTKLPVFRNHVVSDRDAIGMAAALVAIQQGVSIIRTHNVAMTMQAIALWRQLDPILR